MNKSLYPSLFYTAVVSIIWFTTIHLTPATAQNLISSNSTGETTITNKTISTLSTDSTSASEVQKEEEDCQQRLLEEVYACVSRYNIDFNVFLVMVSEPQGSGAEEEEETNSTTPLPILEGTNLTEFRDQICGVRKEIMQCILETAKNLINTEACSRSAPGMAGDAFNQDLLINDQRYLVKEQLEAIIGQYDVFCAHPCRISLLDDMRSCYEEHDLDPKLFISTESSGPVIGADSYDVNIFCKNRKSIVSCLKQTRDDCEESDLVLGAIGLDLDLMEKGFTVLCNNQDAYLQSLKCFESHTQEVGYCHSIKYRGVIRVATRAHEHQWSSAKYYEEICEVILRHIQCDMDAWADKEDEECNEETLTLKRLLHCTLIPSQCQTTQNDSIADACTPPRVTSGGTKSTTFWTFTFTTQTIFVLVQWISLGFRLL